MTVRHVVASSEQQAFRVPLLDYIVAPGRASISSLGRELDGEQPPVRSEDFETAHANAESLASFKNPKKL
jgi:hypothetical protein